MWDIWANQFGDKECFPAVQDGPWDDQCTSNRWRHDYGFLLSILSDKGTSNTNVSGVVCVCVCVSVCSCMHAACVVLSHFSRVWLFAASWSEALLAHLSMGFSRQEYWSILPCSPPRDLPDPGVKPKSLVSPALANRFFTTGTTWEAYIIHTYVDMYVYNIYLYYIYVTWDIRKIGRQAVMHMVTKIIYEKSLKGKKSPASVSKDNREVKVKSKQSLQLEFLWKVNESTSMAGK